MPLPDISLFRPGESCQLEGCGIELTGVSIDPYTVDVTTFSDPVVRNLVFVRYTMLPCHHVYTHDPRPKKWWQTWPRSIQKPMMCDWAHDYQWGMNVTGLHEEYLHFQCFVCRVEWQEKIKRVDYDEHDDYYDSW